MMDAPVLQADVAAAETPALRNRLAQQQMGLANAQWYAEMALLNGASYREVLLAVERARAALDTRVRAQRAAA